MFGKFLVLFFALLSFSSFAKVINGDGRFYSKEEDGVTFVKRQLIYSATKDILSKELKAMNLDADLFWEKYEAKFEEFFQPVVDSLKEKYKVDAEDQTAEQRKNYTKYLRIKRLRALRKFGNLNKIFTSFSIKKISRSTQYPNARYLKMSGRVNRKAVYRIYKKYTFEGEQKNVKNVYISANYKVPHENWSMLGVDSKVDFTKAVEKHWLQWFKTNFDTKFDSIEIAVGLLEEKLEEHLKMSHDALENLKFVQGQSESEISNSNTMLGSVWVKVNFDINLIDFNKIMNRRQFEVSGEMVAYDLSSNKPVVFSNFKPTIHTYNDVPQKKLASQLASLIYKLPIPKYSELNAYFKRNSQNQITRKLRLHNVSNISEVFEVVKLINSKGVVVNMNVGYDSITSGKAVLNMDFSGSEDKAKEILTRLESQKLKSQKRIILPYKDNPYQLLLSSNRSGKIEDEIERFKRNNQLSLDASNPTEN